MKVSTAIVFPGQGSQKKGMLSELSENSLVKKIYQNASDVLNYDLWDLTQNQEDKLNQTEYTQPAILTASYVYWQLYKEALLENAELVVMAGHSLGEYTALVCSGALSFESGVKLVARRGALMQAAVPEGSGAMAAILGLEDDLVLKACDMAREHQIVDAVNFNSKGQVVIAGDHDAVHRAMSFAIQLGAKRALPLPVSVPSHCALMKPAAEELAVYLRQVEIKKPEIPVIHNVDVSIQEDPEKIKKALIDQLDHPVRWVETIEKIEKIRALGQILEVPPGKVLTGLNKRIIQKENLICAGLV